jgi:tetratricopeptide (TPR) repeat protein
MGNAPLYEMRAQLTRATSDQAAALEEAVALAAQLHYEQAQERLTTLLPQLEARGDRARTAEAMFWLGFCDEKEGRPEQAKCWYQRVAGAYAGTPAAAQARQRLERLGNQAPATGTAPAPR